jgi:hypothetical protein
VTEDNPICDKCGKPLLPDVMERGRYTLADEYDDDGRWVSGRHADCQARQREEFKDASKRLDEASKRAQSILSELRSKLR